MNSTSLDTDVKRKSRVVSGMSKMKHSWTLYTGREPTREEVAEKVKSLSFSDMKRILINAGIIDEEGNLTEIYRTVDSKESENQKDTNSDTSDMEIKMETRVSSSMPKMKHSWPLYTGKIPTVEEFAESFKSLTPVQFDHVLIDAGIIDEDGSLTEIYRPE